MCLRPELLLDGFMELRARQWIGDAHADVVRARFLDQAARGENVFELLTEISQLQKVSDADAGRARFGGTDVDGRLGGANGASAADGSIDGAKFSNSLSALELHLFRAAVNYHFR